MTNEETATRSFTGTASLTRFFRSTLARSSIRARWPSSMPRFTMPSTASSTRYAPYTVALSSPGASLDAAVASAARDVMLALTPNQQPRIEQEYAAALADVRDGPAKNQGVLLGQQAARANLDRRADDGIVPGPWPPQQGPITEPVYVPTGKPGDYDFTPPFDAPPLGPVALFPGWGRLTPFIIDLARHRLKGPDPLRSKRYARDVNFLKAYGRLEGSSRTPDQTNTAFFWFEPFAIWNDIATTVLEREHASPWRCRPRSGAHELRGRRCGDRVLRRQVSLPLLAALHGDPASQRGRTTTKRTQNQSGCRCCGRRRASRCCSSFRRFPTIHPQPP